MEWLLRLISLIFTGPELPIDNKSNDIIGLMPISRHINQAGIDLLKKFEGCKLEAYQDSVGIWTVGFGHTGPDVSEGMTITQEEAEGLLKRDLERFEQGVSKAVTVSLTDNQFSALVVFSYNVGLNNLRISTLLKKLNMGKYNEASEEFSRWNTAGGVVLLGLQRRRQAEKELFLT